MQAARRALRLGAAMMRRFGDPPRPGLHYTLRPGCYAILPLKAGLLVTFQREPRPEFQLPGGGIDAGESPLQALHREVREETGWIIARPRRLGAFRRFVYIPEYDMWAEKLCHIYLAEPVRRVGEPSEPGHRDVLLPLADCADLLAVDGDRWFVRRLPGPDPNSQSGSRKRHRQCRRPLPTQRGH